MIRWSTILSTLPVLFLSLTTHPAAGADQPPLTERLYEATGIELFGFVDTRWGGRLSSDPHEKDLSLGEGRLQLELNRDFDLFFLSFKGDLTADAVKEELDGEIRDLTIQFTPAEFLDMKVGRMVSTWGTGDLIFINDLFPKDWQSFFIGRDDEYLKQASNVIKGSFFFGELALDVVYTPLFEGSTFISGERLSYYSPLAREIVGSNRVLDDRLPNRYFSDAETAVRLSRRFGSVEAALYGYTGFWQEPGGMDPGSLVVTYPRLNVWGGSVRMPLLGGIGNLEAGYYDSIQADDGRNPLVKPSEYRLLAGFEKELAEELTGGFQYYLEVIDGYDNYTATLQPGAHARDEYRHLLTLRLTQLLLDQNLVLSLFVYYSPSDDDGYLRPKLSYKLTDDWSFDGGLNLFWGAHDYTFWGQFQDNSNAYIGLRYTF